MNKFEKRSKASYDEKAEQYDSTYDGKFTVKFKRLLCEAVTIGDGTVVADVGCGNGRLLQNLAKKFSFIGYGVDISEKMIECAKSANPGMQFFVAKCDELPFENNSVGTMTVCAAFHHFPAPERFADEAARVLEEGGALYIADVHLCAFLRALVNPFIKFSATGDVKIYSPKQIERLFVAHGFSPVRRKIDGKVQLHVFKKTHDAEKV